jgi:hypothetical protein
MDKNMRPMKDGQEVKNCPIVGNHHCYWSCKYRSNSHCTYPSRDDQKQLEDLRSMRADTKGGL